MGTVIHIHRTNNIEDQFAIDHTYGSPDMLARGGTQGEWNSWRYINPRNHYGEELCTIHYFKNEPIYVNTFNLGAMPSSGSKSVEIGTGLTLIDVVGMFYNDTYDMPVVALSTYIDEIYYNKTTGNLRVAVNNTDAANYKCVIQISYTKNATLS